MDTLEILVVDDDMMCRQMAEFILKKGGYKTFAVQLGEEALSAIGNKDYALILLDVEMPGKDGVETLREIRNMEEKKKDVPVIFLTADESGKAAESAALLKAKGIIKKPFTPGDLLSAVEKVLSINKDSD